MATKNSKPDLSTVAKARQAWSRALRSRRYRQGRGLLRNRGRHCCLGVAGDLCVQAGLARWDSYLMNCELPMVVQRKFGIRDQQVFIEANDTARMSFRKIADYVDGKITKRQLLGPRR